MTTAGQHSPAFDTADALEAAFDWWRDAGVDMDFTNTPVSWLAEPEGEETVTAQPQKRPKPPPKRTPLERAFAAVSQAAPIGGDPAELPRQLDLFREWWMADKSVSTAGPDRRLPPRGVAGAQLFVLIPQPHPDDAEGLLDGGAGRFLSAILRAMQVEPHDAYLASAIPAATGHPDWADLAARGLAGVTRHHCNLVAPGRILVFGRELAPLFDIAADDRRKPQYLTLGERQLPLLLAPSLEELSRTPQRRRTFWNSWLDWTA